MILFFYEIEDDTDVWDELLRINIKMHRLDITQYYHDNPDKKRECNFKQRTKDGGIHFRKYHREYYKNNNGRERANEYYRKNHKVNK